MKIGSGADVDIEHEPGPHTDPTKQIPFAISSANHFAAKLVLLHVMPAITVHDPSRWYTANDVTRERMLVSPISTDLRS